MTLDPTNPTEPTSSTEPVKTQPTVDPSGNPFQTPTPDPVMGEWMAKYVGKGKKYSNPDEVAKAYAHMEEFVATIKQEKDQLATELETVKSQTKSVEEIMSMFRQDTLPQPASTPTQSDDVQKLVAELVEKTLESKTREQQRKIAENDAWQKLTVAFDGEDNAKAALERYSKGDESRKKLALDLGIVDPQGLIRLLKDDNTPFVPTEESRSHSPVVIDSGALTWAKAQQIKKSDEKYYKSREFQVALHRAANNNPNFWR